MKTFFTTFLAILAAAAVISGSLAAKSRLDRWKKAELECLTEMNSMSGAIREISDESQGGNLNELTAALGGMRKAQKRIAETKQLLVSVLENKPFGLPLTRAEKDRLRQMKADIQPVAEESKQKAMPTIATKSATPALTTTPSPSPELNQTESQSSPTPALTTTPSPDFIKLVKPVSIQTVSDAITLEAGLSVPFVSRDDNNVRFHYGNAEYEIPVDATELAK
jgi:hypothetical protein